MTVAPTIFQASDLNQKGRAILDAARAGWARLRDKDGVSLIMLPEERVDALLKVVNVVANLLTIERALAQRQEGQLDLASFGEWTWLRLFDKEDLAEFIQEMHEAVIVAAREQSAALLDETLRRWRVTADVLQDPVRREILLAPDSEPGDVKEG
ncbi:MAG: hypothetical protein EPO21_05350 [Chloroflexota bacterium]|nr:MAG: hypothetical protein EPO21_05350 [Chloroflexota bacterium]